MSVPSASTGSVHVDVMAGSNQICTGMEPWPTLQDAQLRQRSLTASLDTTRSIALRPLPSSGAALSAAFYSPDHFLHADSIERTAGNTTTHSRYIATPQYLTRSFLQHDENCQESSFLHPLIGRIFAYSNLCTKQSTQMSEIAAGFRYFLPDGRLAHEWILFFGIAPARYLDMAPPEVKQAYLDEHDLTPSSMKGWIEDTIKLEQIQEANEISQQLVLHQIDPLLSKSSKHDLMNNTSHTVLDNSGISTHHTPVTKRKRDMPPFKDGMNVLKELGTRFRLEEAKRPRLDPSLDNPFSTAHQCMAPADILYRLRTTAYTVSSASPEPASPTTPTPGACSRSTLSSKRIVASARRPQGTGRPQTQRAAPTQQTLSAHQVISGRPTMLPVQTALQQQQHHPTNRPHISRNRQARSRPGQTRAPGSVQHIGQGNVSKAWNAERVRAFTDIQGYPAEELPFTAVSQYGDEMSRGHTPKSIDPRYCPFYTTLEENITYMTQAATLNRELCARAKVHWTAQQITLYVYWALDLQIAGSVDRTKIQKHFEKAERFLATHPNHIPTASMSNICTDSGLIGDDKHTHDFYLHAMGVNVANHPTGHAAQMITRVIRHVVEQTGDRNVRLSQAAHYARQHGITVPFSQSMSSNLTVADKPNEAIMKVAKDMYRQKFHCMP